MIIDTTISKCEKQLNGMIINLGWVGPFSLKIKTILKPFRISSFVMEVKNNDY